MPRLRGWYVLDYVVELNEVGLQILASQTKELALDHVGGRPDSGAAMRTCYASPEPTFKTAIRRTVTPVTATQTAAAITAQPA